jgi:hypothetical protein
VVRRLPAAPAAPAPVAPSVAVPSSSPPFLVTLQPRSTFWRARKLDLEQGESTLQALSAINAGVGGVSSQIGGLQFPTSVGVTTTLSTADAAVIQRLAEAVESVADVLATDRGGSCAELSTLSNAAFSLVARLTTLTAHMMDLKDVSASSALKKLEGDARLIDTVRHQIGAAGLDKASELFDLAIDPETLRKLAGGRSTDRSPAVYLELNKRAALLLAVKCLVATALRKGDAPDWPPGSVDVGASTSPAPRARKRASRR